MRDEQRPEPRERKQRGGKADDYAAPVLDPYRKPTRPRRHPLSNYEHWAVRRCMTASLERQPFTYRSQILTESPSNYQTPANDTEL